MGKNMKRFMMSVSDDMFTELEKERKDRMLETVQEVNRQIIADYLRNRDKPLKDLGNQFFDKTLGYDR